MIEKKAFLGLYQANFVRIFVYQNVLISLTNITLAVKRKYDASENVFLLEKNIYRDIQAI